MQPQQRKRQATLDGVGQFAMRDGEKGAGVAAAARDTADVDARERMLKIGRDGDPFDGFAGEMFGQDRRNCSQKSSRES